MEQGKKGSGKKTPRTITRREKGSEAQFKMESVKCQKKNEYGGREKRGRGGPILKGKKHSNCIGRALTGRGLEIQEGC